MRTGRRSLLKSLGSTFLIALILIPGRILATTAPPGITLLSCDRSGAIIKVKTPEFLLQPKAIDGESFNDLTVEGWGTTQEEGCPALPQTGILLAMPPGAEATLSAEILQTSTYPLENPLPAPTLLTDYREVDYREAYVRSPAIYGSINLYPRQWAELGEAGWQRNFWVVPIRITPFRVRCAGSEVTIAGEMILRVSFHGARAGGYIPDPLGEKLAKSTLINFNQARRWQEKSGGPPAQTAQELGQFKVLVDRDGLYRISYFDLYDAGIEPTSIVPQTIKLFLQGQQIPLYVEGESDGYFDPEDYILFFGTFPRGTYTYEYLYSHTNVYWLDWGGDPGLRVEQRPAPPGSAPLITTFKAFTRTEVDTIYEKFGFLDTLTVPIDHWMWLRLDSNFQPTFSYLLNLPGLVVSSGNQYDLTVSLRGYTYSESDTVPEHHAIVRWKNNTTLEEYTAFDVTWNDQNAFVASSSIPWNYVSTTQPNELIFSAPNDLGLFSDAFFLNWIKVGYWRNFVVFNDTLLFHSPGVSGPNQYRYNLTGLQDLQVELWNLTRMERLTDFDYAQGNLAFQDSASDTTYYYVAGQGSWLTPQIIPEEFSNWKNPSHGADYIIVTHENFYDAVEPLADHYQAMGMRVIRAKVGDLYDEFSYGLKTPQAIFDFINYAYYSYQPPAPYYILLVGDASWDYKNYDSKPYVDYVPTYAFQSWKWGETSSDNWFASVSGLDPRPDCSIGRLPANSPEEAELLVQKTLSYAQAPPGYWRSQVIFSNGAYSDSIDAPFFDATVDSLIANYFPEWYNPPRVYSLPSAGNEQYQGDDQDLINYINQGAACINYIGHAGNQMWETLDQSEIQLLNNGTKLPFVSGYSCFTGIFSNTTGFGEALILEPDGGAVAYWSNAGVGHTIPNAFINDFLFQNLFSGTGDSPTFGEAILEAKWDYWAQLGNSGEVIRTFTLLGDPGSIFVFEEPDPADTLDTSPPVITFFDPSPSEFGDWDYLDNPVSFSFKVTDSTEIYLDSLRMVMIHTLNGVENIIFNFPEDPLPEGFNFSDSSDQLIGISFEDSLEEGEWQFLVSAYDVLLYGPAADTLKFRVSNQLVMEQPLNYPNPFRDRTSFTFSLSQPAAVTIKIYTVSGKLIRTLSITGTVGYNIYEWDGRDQQGDPLSNGAYLYKIIARNGNQQVEKVEKLAKIR